MPDPMSRRDYHRESHDPSPTKPNQAQLSTSSGHHIHPTTTTSTPAQITVDGSTIKPEEPAGCWFEACPRLADPGHEPCCSTHGHPLCHACYRRTHFVELCNCGRPECATAPSPVAQSRLEDLDRDQTLDVIRTAATLAELEQHATDNPTSARPVGSVVARMLDDTFLTFETFRLVNAARCARWHDGFPEADTWTLADWSNAMCGEAGELANVVKKIRRRETGHRPGAADPTLAELCSMAADEIGDVLAYLDLLATRMGLRLEDCGVRKFNRVSEREGHPERLPEADAAQVST